VLFNVFAFLLLGIAVYLNMYRMNDGSLLSANPVAIKKSVKEPEKNNGISKITTKEAHQN
jgi:hypothetical protein